MEKIKEVIVVEGKNDTKRVQQAVDADTFETGGSALSMEKIKQLEWLQQRRGLIIFTDPDFNGERLRKIINRHISGVKHAFISRACGRPGSLGNKSHRSLGIEHASQETIRFALRHCCVAIANSVSEFTIQDLVSYHLAGCSAARWRREQLGQILGIGYGNAKQFLKRLAMFQINRRTFLEAIAKLNQEDSNGQSTNY